MVTWKGLLLSIVFLERKLTLIMKGKVNSRLQGSFKSLESCSIADPILMGIGLERG